MWANVLSDQQVRVNDRWEMIRLRREMKEAVSSEEYEKASDLRDQIRQIEDEVSGE